MYPLKSFVGLNFKSETWNDNLCDSRLLNGWKCPNLISTVSIICEICSAQNKTTYLNLDSLNLILSSFEGIFTLVTTDPWPSFLEVLLFVKRGHCHFEFKHDHLKNEWESDMIKLGAPHFPRVTQHKKDTILLHPQNSRQ